MPTFINVIWGLSVLFVLVSWIVRNGFYLSRLGEIIARQKVTRLEMFPISPDDVEHLDRAQLDEATRELMALGFEYLTDQGTRQVVDEPQASAPIADPFAPLPSKPPRFVPQGLGRSFNHPQHGCAATFIFSVTKDAQGIRPPVVTSFVAISSISEQGPGEWSYGTTNSRMDLTARALTKLWRSNRRLWTRFSNANAAQLLEQHLIRRAQIARAAGITWKRAITVEDVKRGEADVIRQMRQTFEQLTPLKMAWQLLRLKRENEGLPPEWLGELKGKL